MNGTIGVIPAGKNFFFTVVAAQYEKMLIAAIRFVVV
jgi:hypothetical protein